MSNMRDLLDTINQLSEEDSYELHDSFDIELNEDFVIETGIIGFMEDGIIVEADETMIELLQVNDVLLEQEDITEPSLADQAVTKIMALQASDVIDEAEYKGRKVPLGKPMKGDVKKSKVYVRKPNGKIVKVEFGDPNMRIKKSNPKRRKSFRARHRCDNPGPRWKARYWSCRAW